jgi:hypothetical protein
VAAQPVPPENSIVLLSCPLRLHGWCGVIAERTGDSGLWGARSLPGL